MRIWHALSKASELAPDGFGARSQKLASLAEGESLSALKEWRREYESLLRVAYTWELWGAAFVIGDGCSDDSFLDFRSALVGLGQRRYEMALRDPDSLAVIGGEVGWLELEGFHYPVSDVLVARRIGAIEDPVSSEGPIGRRWKESELPALYPRLSALCREDDQTIVVSPGVGISGEERSFLGFVTALMALNGCFTQRRSKEFVEAIGDLRSRAAPPDSLWQSLYAGIERDWISPKKRQFVFEHIGDGLAWGTVYGAYCKAFGDSECDLPEVAPTWRNYERFERALSEVVVVNKANKTE